jgi:hypothetical protein
VYCTDKAPNDPVAGFAARARAAGWRYAELPTGHYPALTMPRELERILANLAR